MEMMLDKGCLLTKQTVCTMQPDDQVVWHMPHGYSDRHPTVSRVCQYHICRSPVAVSDITV